MKKALLFFVFVLLTMAAAFSQTATLSYQAVVRDSHNKFVRNTDINVDVRISVESTERYYETRTVHTNQNGVVSFSIGDAARTSHTGDELVDITGWHNATISVTFHLTDGDVTTDSPVSAVPYALEAGNSTINLNEYITINGLCDSIENNCTSVVLKNADNHFTGTNTVPSGYDIATTNVTNCSDIVVNACDLFAVFDSLNRRMQAMEDALAAVQQELDEIKPALKLTSDKPEVIYAAPSEEIEIKYTATLLRTDETFSYSWYVNGTLQGSDSNKLVLTTNTSGDFKVLCKATAGSTVLKDSLTTTICVRPTMEYAIMGGNSDDFGKVSITSSTATSASWLDQSGTEIGTWNSGLTDILPAGEYTVVLSSPSGCDYNLTIEVVASPLCVASSLNATYEEGVTVNGQKYVTKVKDIDDNWYNVVNIGGACWTRENMRATKYYDSETQSYVDIADETSTGTMSESDPCRYTPSSGGSTVGYLYNWPAAAAKAADNTSSARYTQGICPEGWHMPSYKDAGVLVNSYHAGMLAGSVPNETWGDCTTEYAPCNRSYSERNSTGFSAVLSGVYFDGFINSVTNFWVYIGSGWAGYYLGIGNSSDDLILDYNSKGAGHSVRCVRDTTPSLSLSASETGTVMICSSPAHVTYTATIINDNPEGYSYSWSVTPAISMPASTTNTITLEYSNSGNYTVNCTATKGGKTINASILTKVGCVHADYCVSDLTVTVHETEGDPISINWGDGQSANSVTVYSTRHTYTVPGTYDITVSNSDGNAETTQVTVTKPHTTCNVSAVLANEAGSGSILDSVSDHQGNWYEVVQIGSQCWLKENMRATTSPKTGASIVGSGTPLLSYTSKIAYWYDNNNAFYAPKNYGLLYNWCAALDTFKTGREEVATTNATENSDTWHYEFSGNCRGICPAGWHVPTNEEWNVMESEVNGSTITTTYNDWNRGSHAGKLSTSCDWADIPNWGDQTAPGDYAYNSRNSSGFSVLPAGGWNTSGFFDAATATEYGSQAYFWTSSDYSDTYGLERILVYSTQTVMFYNYEKTFGMSVRCVRD